MGDIIEKTVHQIFKLVADEKKIYGKLTQETLSMLNCIFPTTLEHALDLVDRGYITKLITPSKRELFQVKGSSGIPYFCFPSCNYCTCPSYLYSVLLKRESFLCKHLVALRIATALDRHAVRDISDQEYTAYVAYETDSPIKKENR